MALVAEHRHAVERIVFEQPPVEPVPVFRHVYFGMVFRLCRHDVPDMRIFEQFCHALHTAGILRSVNETDKCLWRMLQHSRQIPLFLVPAERGRREPCRERYRLRQPFRIRLQEQPLQHVRLGSEQRQQAFRVCRIPELQQFLIQVKLPCIPFRQTEAVFEIVQQVPEAFFLGIRRGFVWNGDCTFIRILRTFLL